MKKSGTLICLTTNRRENAKKYTVCCTRSVLEKNKTQTRLISKNETYRILFEFSRLYVVRKIKYVVYPSDNGVNYNVLSERFPLFFKI